MSQTLISFVIPCYRSEKTVETVINQIICKVAERSEFDYEIVAVNDCSPDNVWSVLFRLANENKKIKAINLSKNMNKPSAQMAAFAHVSGDIIVELDDDGQCPVEKLWELIEPLFNGYDVAIARYPVKKQSAFKNFGSFVNRKMTEWVLKKPKDIVFSNFGAMRRYIVDEIVRYKNPYPYLTGLILRSTSKIVNVPMEEHERMDGNTGFSFRKMVSLWLNGLTAFSIIPLRIASILGVVCACFGFVLGVYFVINRILHPEMTPGYSSLISALFFIGGLLMMIMGVVGEYIGRIYISINSSPQYVIKDSVNLEDTANAAKNR